LMHSGRFVLRLLAFSHLLRSLKYGMLEYSKNIQDGDP
jgi:hypothetical protein